MAKDLQRERTTLTEVALRAGVSASTVSLVLSGKAEQRRIPQETSERVWRAADDLNYAPNLLTRSLRGARTHVISFFSGFRNRTFGDLYMDQLGSAVEAAGGEAGYDILVHCNYKRSLKEIYQFLNGGMADGLLMFAPKADDPLVAMLRRSQLPVVFLGTEDLQGQYSSVRDDRDMGIRLVADAMLEHGHRRMAAMGIEGDYSRDANTRIHDLQEELFKRGVPMPDDMIAWVGHDPEPGLMRLLEHPNPPTALFCWHDFMAYRILEICDARGIKVPEQLSIVGYDGLHWPSTSTHISASLEVDLSALAREAIHLLDKSITDPLATVEHRRIPVQFNPGTTLSGPNLQRSKP